MNMTLPTFKLCLVALGLGVALCACSSIGKSKGPQAVLRLHIQSTPDGSERSAPVPIYRAHPILINVDKASFLDERSITNAVLVDSGDSFAIEVRFSHSGAKILEQYSTTYRSRHCAIASSWGEKYYTNRWLAAPIFSKTIFDGKLVFTPDASREEAVMIVEGLNNHAKDIQNSDLW